VTWTTVALWVHPVVGFVAVALAVRAASLGFGARRPGRRAARSRAAHRRATPWLYAAMAVSWVSGWGSVELLREDIEEAASGHFTVGCVIMALFTLAALLSRRVPDDPRARALHPLVAGVAVLLTGVQIFLGLQIMPH